jgi:pimeloyl-ACP methyl ester carboxylesterase
VTELERQTAVQSVEVGSGSDARRIATIIEPGALPGVMWLQGFNSEMVSLKATALHAWSSAHGVALTRFDYSGHGQSDGRFEDGTIGQWLDEAIAVFTRCTEGRQVVVGSSMGGYLALALTKQLMCDQPEEAARIKAVVLIAPAWDMTEELMWKRFPEDARRAIAAKGVFLRPSQYGDPYPITRRLIEDGRNHLIGQSPWDPGRPVRILHGRLDPDVPFAHSERLMQILTGHDQRLIAIDDGEHRLSRPQDLDLLIATIEEVR